MICIIPIGSVVQIKLAMIDAIVTSAVVGKHGVMYYNVEYMADDDMVSLQLTEDQIIYHDDRMESIV